jgi:hypothetical protein
MNRLQTHAIAVLAWLLLPTAVMAESVDLRQHPLVVPKPAQPRLRLPEMRVPHVQSPGLGIEPLQMRRAQPRPRLNGVPNLAGEPESEDEDSDEHD